MARAGRASVPGPRWACGKRKPEKKDDADRKAPTDPSQSFDAIGRAYLADLLGPKAAAKRDMARIVQAQYWAHYGDGYFSLARSNPLARFQPIQSFRRPETDEERAARESAREESLNKTLAKIGPARRLAFDQLVIDPYPDFGPMWLDRIIAAKREGRQPSSSDERTLRLALEGLDLII